MKPYNEYVNKVLTGTIITGKSIQLACERFQSDLLREDIEFRENEVDRAINFISTLKHFTGKHSGKPFILEG
jgi:phage terminase large subunit-like protein